MQVGDPFEASTNQGPQVSKEQYDQILRYIESGKKQGATVAMGGNAVGDKGYFIEPTIFTDVKVGWLQDQNDYSLIVFLMY